MSEDLNNGALRLAVAQICQSMGWDALNKSTHDLLTEVLQKYMLEIAKCAQDYSQLYCHTEPSLDDLGLAFSQTGVILHELEDYVSQVDQVPFSYQLPQFPMPKPNLLQYPRKEDILDRPEFYHDHLPPLLKALQQNEDEREGNKEESIGIDDTSSQSFLRNEIKTIGKDTENEFTENSPDKRSLAVLSSPDLESDSKRRRVEKENNLDILQVLQEKNNIKTLSPSSPDIAPENVNKPLFTFTSTSTPTPPINIKKPKAEKSSEDKKLLSPPRQKPSKKASPSRKKTPEKPKNKDVTSSKQGTAIKSPPAKKPLQFSKPKTPKKNKSKASTPKSQPQIKVEPVIPPLTLTPMKSNVSREETSKQQPQTMPKLIIKPMKLEKNQSSGYSVSSIPVDDSLAREKSISSTPMVGEPKPKKKKKDSSIAAAASLSGQGLLPLHTVKTEIPSTSSDLLNRPVLEKAGETIKKKKKKHKDKDRDRDKSKTKKIKDVSASMKPSVHIPTIKLKLENTPTTTIPSQTIPTQKISVAGGEPKIIKPQEEVPQRTVITETLSTTVQVYYCPACGLADDGSFMIGCDGTCDRWYHGACVGIVNDPGGDWYCEECQAKKTKKKKKKKKAKTNE